MGRYQVRPLPQDRTCCESRIAPLDLGVGGGEALAVGHEAVIEGRGFVGVHGIDGVLHRLGREAAGFAGERDAVAVVVGLGELEPLPERLRRGELRGELAENGQSALLEKVPLLEAHCSFALFGKVSTNAWSMPVFFSAAVFRKNSWHERCQMITGKSGASLSSIARDSSPWK